MPRPKSGKSAKNRLKFFGASHSVDYVEKLIENNKEKTCEDIREKPRFSSLIYTPKY
jgi:hypothetical protein